MGKENCDLCPEPMKKLTWIVLRTKGKILRKYIFYQPNARAIPGEYQPARSTQCGTTAARSVLLYIRTLAYKILGTSVPRLDVITSDVRVFISGPPCARGSVVSSVH